MRHRAAGRNAVDLIGERARRSGAAADIRRSCTQNRRVASLCAPGAEFQNNSALCRAADTVCLRRNQALMVESQQQESFNQLRLDCGRSHGENRLLRENRRALRHGPDIAREAEAFQVV